METAAQGEVDALAEPFVLHGQPELGAEETER